MKTQLTLLAILSALTFNRALLADDIVLPVIGKPTVLEEGTQRVLSAGQIAEISSWAKNTKGTLLDLLDNVEGLATSEKVERLREGIKNAVGESAPKDSELFMRYILNRSLVVSSLLDNEMDQDQAGSVDSQVRMLISSIKLALKYYDVDVNVTLKNSSAPFVQFGIDYFSFLNEQNNSIYDASAQYKIEKTALEWLQWDLYRDLKNSTYASQIMKINNGLKSFPDSKMSDKRSLDFLRQMKKIARSLDLKVADVAATGVIVPKYSVMERGMGLVDSNCAPYGANPAIGESSTVVILGIPRSGWAKVKVISNTLTLSDVASVGCVGEFPFHLLRKIN